MTATDTGKRSHCFTFAEQQPWEPGVYGVQTAHSRESRFSYWNGSTWRCTASDAQGAFDMRRDTTACTITHWWGLAAPTAPPPLYVQETMEQACARVPALRPLMAERIDQSAAAVCTAADTLPGYRLAYCFSTPTVFVYRREAACTR